MFLTEIYMVLETITLVSIIAGTAALIVASTHDKRPRVPGEIEEKSKSQEIAALCAIVGLIASLISIPVAILSVTNREADNPTPAIPPVTYTAEDGTVHSVADDPAGVSWTGPNI